MNGVQEDKRQVLLQKPGVEHASAIYRLVENCKPLDLNSEYLYLLLCAHYSDTCVAAFLEDQLVGAATGYLLPERPQTLFVWQIAVSPKVRKLGLGRQMIRHLLNRKACSAVDVVEATVSPSNKASLGLFESLARDFNTEFQQSSFFEKKLFFNKNHEEENLVRVGPFKAR